MSEKNLKQLNIWARMIRGMWRSPLGLVGVVLCTVCATLLVLGLAAELVGFTENVYVSIFAFMILPLFIMLGLILIPIAAYLRRRQWRKYGIARDYLRIDLSEFKHRRLFIWLIVLTVLSFTVLASIGIKGYEFTNSPEFCGTLCHNVMAPEYTIYQRSSHAKVPCVECHIGSKVSWFVKAKISGLRQVQGVLTDNYHRPIPVPVEHLRPSRYTCEECHWPDKFSGKRVKSFVHYTNDNQQTPIVNKIGLHIGGKNMFTGKYEGIHWHVSKGIEIQYLAEAKRHDIAKIRVVKLDGSYDEFVKDGVEIPEDTKWRTMDCIDCHNRPTHVFEMPENMIDAGLYSKKIDMALPGIREDCLTVITKEYKSRAEAKVKMIDDLRQLQVKRNGKDFAKAKKVELQKAGEFILASYLANVWPDMNIKWGTYGSHLGHQRSAEGFGCMRCHDGEHINGKGDVVPHDCDLCHDNPA